MYLLWTLLIGLLAGGVARLLIPGRQPGGCLFTLILGVAGAFLATFIGQAVHWYAPGERAGFIGAVVGAAILLLVFGAVSRRR